MQKLGANKGGGRGPDLDPPPSDISTLPPDLDSVMFRIVDNHISNFANYRKNIITFLFGALRLISNKISYIFLVFNSEMQDNSTKITIIRAASAPRLFTFFSFFTFIDTNCFRLIAQYSSSTNKHDETYFTISSIYY